MIEEMLKENRNGMGTVEVGHQMGAGGREIKRDLRILVKLKRPEIMSLVETRVPAQNGHNFFCSLGYKEETTIEGEGFAGGIWVAWDETRVNLRCIERRSQYGPFEVKYDGEEPWWIVLVYVAPREREKGMFWRDMVRIAEDCRGHHRILLSLIGKGRERPFRFEVAWFLHDTFEKKVREGWEVRGEATEKLMNVRGMLGRWNTCLKKKEVGGGGLEDDVCYSRVEEEVWNRLERMVTLEEVREAIFSIGVYKALGIYGFLVVFLQKEWHVIGNEVMSFVQKVWKRELDVQEVNTTMLVKHMKGCDRAL
ncbi:hypothetical protein K1719_030197 [Acacia pycnantha]|nr:hypothetical protein K1719_030197 [Acacia pycnantha]